MKTLPFCLFAVFFIAFCAESELSAQWTNGQSADVVLGQTNFTNRLNSLPPTSTTIYGPQGVAVDPTTGKVFIADAMNNRVLRLGSTAALINGSSAEAVLGQPDFVSRNSGVSQNTMNFPVDVVVDKVGRLYVVDNGNNRVVRFDNAASKANGANADGVFGQTDFVSASFATAQNRMFFPRGVAVDTAGRLYVAEGTNNRILRFDNAAAKSNGANADGVLGQTSFTSNGAATTQSGMRTPQDVAVDNAGRLYVADINNNRVLRFDNAAAKPNGNTADVVFGQSNFISLIATTTQNGMWTPTAVALDTSSGHLYVSERINNRVTRFNNAATKATGAPADGVLGQSDFISRLPSSSLPFSNSSAPINISKEVNNDLGVHAPSQLLDFENVGVTNTNLQSQSGRSETFLAVLIAANKITAPAYLALDASGRLYVADNGNRRVLRFDNAAGKPNGANADGVIGQPDLSTVTSIITASNLYAPGGVAIDRTTGKLFVADGGNNRVLRWSSANAAISGSAAEAVLGQPDLTLSKPDSGQSGMVRPFSLAIDNSGRLWVLDGGNFRILRFDNASTKTNGALADGVLGQPNFTTRIVPDTNNITGMSLFNPVNITLDGSGNLYVADGNGVFAPHRVLRWNNAAAKPNGALPDGILGQLDLTSWKVNKGRGTTIAADGMNAPFGVTVDNAGRLYVADLANNRILRFDNAAAKPNGAPADAVLGQNDFSSGSRNKGGVVGADGVNYPVGLAVDGTGNLYVGDSMGRRVLIFKNAASKPNGGSADFVLGHLAFTTNAFNGVTQNSLSGGPNGITLDNVNGKLWIATGSFAFNNDNRVLRFSANGPLVSVERINDELPRTFELGQNYPNPFNPSTNISFSLPARSFVSLRVFDLLGREIVTLVSEELSAGSYAREWKAEKVPSGVYLYRLQADSFTDTKKLLLLR